MANSDQTAESVARRGGLPERRQTIRDLPVADTGYRMEEQRIRPDIPYRRPLVYVAHRDNRGRDRS